MIDGSALSAAMIRLSASFQELAMQVEIAAEHIGGLGLSIKMAQDRKSFERWKLQREIDLIRYRI